MKRFRKFLLLTWTERCLLVKAVFLLGLIRLGLWLISFKILWSLLGRVTRKSAGLKNSDQAPIDRIVWAVRAASRYVPKARNCLPQALAIQVLLRQEGFPARLHIGIARGEGEQLEAHSWLECEGRIVIGGSELEHYTRLTIFEGKSI